MIYSSLKQFMKFSIAKILYYSICSNVIGDYITWQFGKCWQIIYDAILLQEAIGLFSYIHFMFTPST